MATEIGTRETDNGDLILTEFSPGRGQEPMLDLCIREIIIPLTQDDAVWLARKLIEWAQDHDGWVPFSSDTPESAAAWSAGRLHRRTDGPQSHAPEAREVVPYYDNQDHRIEWERGWTYQDALMRCEADGSPV